MLTNEAIAHFHKNTKKSAISSEYLYSYLSIFDYDSLGSTSSIATAVNSKTIKAMLVLVSDESVREQFTLTVSPIFKKIKSLSHESATLSNIRDTLLPKLISGELPIKNAEKFLEQAGV